jgi:hypothetical protein
VAFASPARVFTDVVALTANDVWAIGYQFSFSVPEKPQAHNELWRIAPDGVGGLWAVGNFLVTDFSQPLSSLVLRGSQ